MAKAKPAAPQITEEHYLSALQECHDDERPKLGAIDPAKLAGLAKMLAKQTPAILALLAAFGVPVPPVAQDAAKVIIDKLTDGGFLDSPAPAA